MERVCKECNFSKSIVDFPLKKNGKPKSSYCKDCYTKIYYHLNKEKVSLYKKEYYENNKEEILSKSKVYYIENKKEKMSFAEAGDHVIISHLTTSNYQESEKAALLFLEQKLEIDL